MWNFIKQPSTLTAAGLLFVAAAVMFPPGSAPPDSAEGEVPTHRTGSPAEVQVLDLSQEVAGDNSPGIVDGNRKPPEELDYTAFSDALRELLSHGQDAGILRNLFISLYEPESYLERLNTLRTYEPGPPGTLPPYRDTAAQHSQAKLKVSATMTEGGNLRENDGNFGALYPRMFVELELPDHRHVERVITRWIDMGAGQVIHLGVSDANRNASGQRLLTTRMDPEYSLTGAFRIEVYDAGEQMHLLTATSVAAGDSDHVARSSLPPPLKK